MPLNTFTFKLPIPDSPDLSGPDELARVLISLRQSARSRIAHIGSGKLAPISNEGLRRLISLAYYTSLATEEGRFPRFKLISTDQREINLRGAARFNTPINDVGTMLRLAPSVEDTDAALIIAEVDGELTHSPSCYQCHGELWDSFQAEGPAPAPLSTH